LGGNKIFLANGTSALSIGIPFVSQQIAAVIEPTTEAITETTVPVTEPETTTEQATETTAEEVATEETTSETTTETDIEDHTVEAFAAPNEASEIAAQNFVSEAVVLDISEQGNVDITTVENLNSVLVYPNAFPGADLEYILQPDKLKESVIVREKSDHYEYKFTLDLQNLIAQPQKDGTIHLVSATDNKLQFKIEAPYAIDAAGESSFDALSMEISGNILTLTADPKWMNASERTFPVALDPTYAFVVPDLLGMTTATITEGAVGRPYDILKQLQVGKSDGLLGKTNRSLIKFDLPVLPNAGVITNAQLLLKSTEYLNPFSGETLKLFSKNAKDIKIGAYEVVEEWWGDQVTWKKRPEYDHRTLGIGSWLDITKIDTTGKTPAGIISLANTYLFDITDAAKRWYDSPYAEKNHGILLKAMDESKAGKMKFAAFSTTIKDIPIFPDIDSEGRSTGEIYSFNWHINSDAGNPVVAISYVNNVGLENYWTYETLEMGQSGAAYINHYNGGLTYSHADVTLAGERMPFTLSHNYVSAHQKNVPSDETAVADEYVGSHWGMEFGVGFRLNLLEEIVQTDPVWEEKPENAPTNWEPQLLGFNSYYHIDGDGTYHYYTRKKDDSTVFEDVTNPNTTMTKTDDEIVIKDELGNRKQFLAGEADHYYLRKITDTNQNVTQIIYDDGQIKKIIDAVDREIELFYENGFLSYMIAPNGVVTAFTYDEPKDDPNSILTIIPTSMNNPKSNPKPPAIFCVRLPPIMPIITMGMMSDIASVDGDLSATATSRQIIAQIVDTSRKKRDGFFSLVLTPKIIVVSISGNLLIAIQKFNICVL
jgi:hypothetical protein